MANVDAGVRPLLAPVQRTDRETVDALLRAGADINARSHWWCGGRSVLDECAPELAEFLMERGALLDAHAAARLGMLERLREIVEADPATVGRRGANGQMPLHFASTVAIAEYLLERGAEIEGDVGFCEKVSGRTKSAHAAGSPAPENGSSRECARRESQALGGSGGC